MNFDEIKSFLHVNRFGITNPGTKKLSKILMELVDAVKAAFTSSSSSVDTKVSELKTVYGFPEFSAETTYQENDLVVYGGKLYKCKSGGHTAGAWDATDFTVTTLAAEVANIMKTPAPSAGGGEAS